MGHLIKKADLEKLPEVNWDRMTDTMIFGWVEREDEYKDFVVFAYSLFELRYFTSSPKMHAIIEKRLGFDEKKRLPCRRVEQVFPGLSNCVRLKK